MIVQGFQKINSDLDAISRELDRLLDERKEMLAALYKVRADAFEHELEPSYSIPESAMESVRAAIAKAEGK